MTHLDQTPDFSLSETLAFASTHFGLGPASAKPLPSERDQNFLISTATERWVLKISNGQESTHAIAGQNQMLEHLGRSLQLCPEIRNALDGSSSIEVSGKSGSSHIVRIVSFLEGRPLADVKYRSDKLLRSIGIRIAELTDALDGFEHPSFHRPFHWDLAEGVNVVSARLHLINDDQLKQIELCLAEYQRYVLPIADSLPQSIIHNDANDGNVVVSEQQHGQTADRVTGLIDFGDAVYSYTVAELAIAIAYAILESDDPLLAACEMVAGYTSRRQLSDNELTALFGMVRLRMCVSAAIAAEQQSIRPDDKYLSVSQAPIRSTLPALCSIPYNVAIGMFRNAAGLPPVPQSRPIVDWIDRQHMFFAFPIERTPASRLVPVDLSAASVLLTGDPSELTVHDVDQAVERAVEVGSENDVVSPIAVGRYLEPRLLYSGQQYSSGENGLRNFDVERRTIHLGIDLFASARTPVFAVLDGIVERVDVCADPLDYGTLIILRHDPADGITFFTLYGHVSSDCQTLMAGQSVQKGQKIAELGPPDDNGGWSPHLHFQLTTDLLDIRHNFPGVCRRSQQQVWAQICPDPSALLGVEHAAYESEKERVTETLKRRRRNLGRSLSIGYRKPLKLVRGWKHFLFDESGHRYLDAYNNVPHVGHAHPRIVAALNSQAALLNTNTRYLHDLQNEFAEALCATMPEPLSVCYFLNSASEANELALRLARTATGRKDVIVLEDAYHGNSTSLIDISPYKHNGPGGNGPPNWVHTVPVADVYRGDYRDPETAGTQYANEVLAALNQLSDSDRSICAFIAESCPSVGGQIVFPDGYLNAVYKYVRAAGGICIADEVQTGYGRLGRYFYGFEQQHVIPDIVVLGKPIGNGHPLAAVVTTDAIADSFNNGMEFFSTFGGNCVSCAVGLEVLRTIDDERLPQNATDVGRELLAQLAQLKDKYTIIGDVRGIGFFIGVELVREHSTLEPAGVEASFIANRMRDRGVLLGIDGPHHSVVKIRPPMTFDPAAATILLTAFEESILELSTSN